MVSWTTDPRSQFALQERVKNHLAASLPCTRIRQNSTFLMGARGSRLVQLKPPDVTVRLAALGGHRKVLGAKVYGRALGEAWQSTVEGLAAMHQTRVVPQHHVTRPPTVRVYKFLMHEERQ